MAGKIQIGRALTVVVTARGMVLDEASFDHKADAESYKSCVRRWALEKGVLVEVWSHGAQASRRASTLDDLLRAAAR